MSSRTSVTCIFNSSDYLLSQHLAVLH